MTRLLELRERIKQIYSRIETFLLPLVKFLLAFLALNMVNGKLGYMSAIDNLAIVLIAALACSFLPNICITLFAALFSLLHLYSLSLEAAIVGGSLYLIIFLLFFRFSPKNSLIIVITPMLFAIHLPYVMPIAVGLLSNPAAAIPMACGIMIYYFFSVISGNAEMLATVDSDQLVAKIRLLIDSLLDHRTMIVVIIAFLVTVIAVYIIRRLSVDYAWTIAMIAGAIINLVILLVGDLLYSTNISLPMALLGSVLAILVAKILEFFRFCVDYNRVEKVQFEDDEYYYYVKAIPKMTVTAQANTVKKIHSQHAKSSGSSRDLSLSESSRNVVTESVGRRDMAQSRTRVLHNQQVTIGGQDTVNDFEDYDDQ
ncbi:MAG: hypothetical protein LBM60_08660 [Clostridium sp.]|jgi:hypothetical protein|nr:hypothetical protein [Clostridium sp.]